MTILWKMRFLLRDYWKQYLFAFVALQIVAIINQIPPWLIGRIVDRITSKTLTTPILLLALAAIVGSAVAIYGLRYVWRALLYGASVNIVRNQRDLLFNHLTRMSPAFFQRHDSGTLMAHATNDLNAVEDCVGGGIMTLIDSFIAGATVLLAMIFAVSGKLTLMVLAPFPFLIWTTALYGSMTHRRFRAAQASFSSLNEETRETVSGIRAVRAHQLNERQYQRFSARSRQAVHANRQVANVEALFVPSIQLFFGLAFVIALMGGAWMIKNQALTIGMLTTFTLYLGQLLGPMMQLGWQFSIFQRGSVSWLRLQTLFQQQPDIQDADNPVDAPQNHDLYLRIPSFTYPKAPHPALNDITLTVPFGSFIGITGRTGSGKSTLFRLLLREFNLPTDASITLGGIAIDRIRLQALRKQMTWVPQEPMLFSGTIADNIAFAKPHASQHEIEQAAKLAAIHDEITDLKQGYQTLLGEHGINLSGGQKQRVAFARALLCDAPIILLDDAFSALDMKTEAIILKNLGQYRGKKTILLITQRLPELIYADHIVVIDESRIVEQGSHGALLANEQWYARIFRQQARTLQMIDLETTPPAAHNKQESA